MKILVTRPSLPPFDEYVKEIQSIWETKWLTNAGPKHQQLEAELKEYLGVEQLSLFANGHLALQTAIRAMGLTGEVITTPFTFASTTHAIVECGLTPVFCDIDPNTLTIDPKKIEGLITERTSAILPVHVYGTVCHLEEIDRIAKRHGLKVIYDAAHTFGEEVDGKGIGSFGDISMFSFHATKVYNTVEGGGLAYRDADLKRKIESIRQFGLQGGENPAYVGTNAKMTELHAAMGICNLRYVEQNIAKREKIVQIYRKGLERLPGVTLAPIQQNVKQNFAYFPVIFDDTKFGMTRDEVCDKLQGERHLPEEVLFPLSSRNTTVTEGVLRRIRPLQNTFPTGCWCCRSMRIWRRRQPRESAKS